MVGVPDAYASTDKWRKSRKSYSSAQNAHSFLLIFAWPAIRNTLFLSLHLPCSFTLSRQYLRFPFSELDRNATRISLDFARSLLTLFLARQQFCAIDSLLRSICMNNVAAAASIDSCTPFYMITTIIFLPLNLTLYGVSNLFAQYFRLSLLETAIAI